MKQENSLKAKILVVVGARPNFMKAAPLLAAMREHNLGYSDASKESEKAARIEIESILVHTGQHYDGAMSDKFFADLNIPKPDAHLGVGSGSHATQTAEVMRRFEEVLLRERPQAVIVVGDVNSTLACALVAAKIPVDSNWRRPLIAHVEAGLRSFDREMPEEINRIVADHLADLLFVTEESGLVNLRKEGIQESRVHFVGNTMIDSLLACVNKADESDIYARLRLGKRAGTDTRPDGFARYALLTLHRPSNVDTREGLLNILEGLSELKESCRVIFPAHPRTEKRIKEFQLEQHFSWDGEPSGDTTAPDQSDSRIRLIAPLGYIDFLALMKRAALVITDSGGVQEETTALQVPCVTVRNNTERPVTVHVGTNVLAGTSATGIRVAIRRQCNGEVPGKIPNKWDGHCAQRILKVLCHELERVLSIE